MFHFKTEHPEKSATAQDVCFPPEKVLRLSSRWLRATRFGKLHISKLPFCSFSPYGGGESRHPRVFPAALAFGGLGASRVSQAPTDSGGLFPLSITHSLKYQALILD